MKRRKVPENKSCQLSPEPLEFGLLNCFRSITELLLIFFKKKMTLWDLSQINYCKI